VNALDALDALQLNDDQAFYQDIDSISAIKFRAFVVDRQWNFFLKLETAKSQFVAKAIAIGRLQQASTQFAMHFNACADDPISQISMN
jgi:hypothetical protein